MRKRFAAESADEPRIGYATMSAATRARYSSGERCSQQGRRLRKNVFSVA